MKVIILCGGEGTRLKEETEYRPKPMVMIGNRPMLWHIMKIYSANGFNEFVLPLGYKGDMIKEYFMQYHWRIDDFCLDLKSKKISFEGLGASSIEDWKISFVDTGLKSETALRLFKLKNLLKNDDIFMVTYGDGVADIDINKVIEQHKKSGKVATITALNPISRYGVINIDDNIVTDFREKPVLDDYINAGFMVFSNRIFDYIDDSNISLEELLKRISLKGEVSCYIHKGFWHCMDTYKDYKDLNKMWDIDPKWKLW